MEVCVETYPIFLDEVGTVANEDYANKRHRNAIRREEPTAERIGVNAS